MIRLIACDLDGTLLNDQGLLPQGIFDMIRALKARGVRFAAASGRQYGNVKRLFLPVWREMDFICENGALISAGGVFTADTFPRQMASEIIRDILNAGMELLISAPETSYVLSTASRAYVDDLVYRLKNTVTLIDDPADVLDEAIKISGFHPGGVAPIAPPVQEKWRGKVNCDIAGRDWLDFTRSNKGTGVRALAASLGISLAHAAAFGDQFNDESMLSAVGHPYIMDTAPAPLLNKGYTICHSVMDVLENMLRQDKNVQT